MLSFGAGYITADLGKTMQGAPVKSEGEDGLPVPPYAIYTIDINDWAESICRVVCGVLWWSLVKDIEIILFCEKEKSHPELGGKLFDYSCQFGTSIL